MESALKLAQRVDAAQAEEHPATGTLMEEIREVARQIACNDLWFDLECDEYLIESCIFQRESLQARYRYLLNQARRQGICCASFQK